jgi:putative oxidoreductase
MRIHLFVKRYELIGMSLLMLCIRCFMAQVFFYSGLAKISNWSGTVFLFQNEYKVPIIPPEIAAYLAAGIELTCPILLVLGLFTRLAALPMLAMAVVIQLTYLSQVDHLYWMMLLLTIIFYGAGKISLDRYFHIDE